MYYKTPTQYNVSMANALQRYVEKQTTTIRQNTYILGIGQMFKYTIYKLQNDMMFSQRKTLSSLIIISAAVTSGFKVLTTFQAFLNEFLIA